MEKGVESDETVHTEWHTHGMLWDQGASCDTGHDTSLSINEQEGVKPEDSLKAVQ